MSSLGGNDSAMISIVGSSRLPLKSFKSLPRRNMGKFS